MLAAVMQLWVFLKLFRLPHGLVRHGERGG